MTRRILISGFLIAWFVTGAFGTPPPPAPMPRATSAYLSAADSRTDVDSCDFDVQIVTTGYGILHTNFNADGTVKKILLNMPRARVTFTNVENGKTLWTPTTALTKITYDSAGHITAFTTSGVTWRIVVPGHGSVIADVGQVGWRIHYDRNGNIVSSKPVSSGQRDGFSVSKLCQYLD